jgi:hypothetical protein
MNGGMIRSMAIVNFHEIIQRRTKEPIKATNYLKITLKIFLKIVFFINKINIYFNL